MSSLEEASQSRREAEASGTERDNLVTRLNQMEREVEELKKAKTITPLAY